MARTVRDFKNYALRLENCRDHFAFCKKSYGHREFWEMLNQLGGRNLKTQPAQSCPDIDATVVLSDREWELLKNQVRNLITSTMADLVL
jgi:hypothetical protein